jgi:hypothetical protein
MVVFGSSGNEPWGSATTVLVTWRKTVDENSKDNSKVSY